MRILKSAGVRQDRAVPRHKTVQAAQIVHEAVTGSQMQMVGVGKLDLTADGLEVRRAQRALDGTLRADVHEHGRLHRAVRAGKYAPPRLPFGFLTVETWYTPAHMLIFNNIEIM